MTPSNYYKYFILSDEMLKTQPGENAKSKIYERFIPTNDGPLRTYLCIHTINNNVIHVIYVYV